MYATEVSYGVSSSKNIIPMFSKIPRHWLIRFVIGCGQFWLLPRTAEETNDLDTQRNQAGGAFRVCDGTKSLGYLSRYRAAPTHSGHKNLLKNPSIQVDARCVDAELRAVFSLEVPLGNAWPRFCYFSFIVPRRKSR